RGPLQPPTANWRNITIALTTSESAGHLASRRLFGSNRRRQIKEIPWRRPKGSIRLRIIGRPATFLMSGQISFTLFLMILMGAPIGRPLQPSPGRPNHCRDGHLTWGTHKSGTRSSVRGVCENVSDCKELVGEIGFGPPTPWSRNIEL